MTRAIWKGKFIYKYLLSNKFFKRHRKEVWARNSAIPAKLIGKPVYIHNGNTFIKTYITREKVGFKFGEFAYTRKHTKKFVKVQTKKKPAKK